MVFSSIVFLYEFLIVAAVLYRLVPRRLKNVFLLIASLAFYAWGEPKYVLLLCFSAVFNYLCGIAMTFKYKRTVLITGIVVNIGTLIYFKYTNFFLSCISPFFPNGSPVLNIVLPLGISFYTFQALSYLADVYKGKTSPQKNLIDFALYLSFFPKLTQGPIVKYSDIADQLKNRHDSGTKFMDGITRFSAGLCKKVLIADNIGGIWSAISAYDFTGLSCANAWLGIIAYTLQIYFDFSGYSDMAIGLGKMFGFKFAENFNYPYISRSVSEFWRRWHISLGMWFREYIYIPLGGNRKGTLRTYLNILIVWMLTGFWHGASWNFILWGLYYALLLMIEKTFLKKPLKKIGYVSCIYTMFFVIIGWVMFSLDGAENVLNYIKAMFNFSYLGFGEQGFLYTLTSYSGLLIIAISTASGIPKKLYDGLMPKKLYFVKYIFAALGFVLSTAYLMNETFNSFLYFKF